MNFRIFYLIAALSGALAVALGALGAHALQKQVDFGVLTPANIHSFETAVKYHLLHSILLMLTVYFAKHYHSAWLRLAAYFFIFGIVFFAGSIYILSTRALIGLKSVSWLGPVTPIGGLCMIAGWILLGIGLYSIKHHQIYRIE